MSYSKFEAKICNPGLTVAVTHWVAPQYCEHTGQFVQLIPLDPQNHGKELYRASHFPKPSQRLWTFMFDGPFDNEGEFLQYLSKRKESTTSLSFTVLDKSNQLPVGLYSIMNIDVSSGKAELGNIWYSPSVHGSKINTESTFLLLQYLFEKLFYRRVEWKCDSLNEPSRISAKRMGFRYEGLFRQHFIVKGRNRDTAWYSMIDSEWPKRKSNFQNYLYDTQKYSLKDLNSDSILDL